MAKMTQYYEPKQKPSKTALLSHIQDLYLQFQNYGYRRITNQLHREGMIINHKKVARIMRENGLSCRSQERKWFRTMDCKHRYTERHN